jgi:hypothetical protein
VSSPAERIAEAKARDEEGIEQGDPEEIEQEESTPFEAPEQPDTEPETQPEPEQPEQPAAPAGMSADQADELDKAYKAYAKRVAKALHGELPPDCRACGGLGFDLTGGQGEPEFQAHEKFRGCDDCKGLGKVATGSKVMGHDLADCPDCLGRGYLERLPAMTAVPDQPAEYGTPSWMGNVPMGGTS